MASQRITDTPMITVREMIDQDPNGFVEFKGKFYRMNLAELSALVGLDRTEQVHAIVQDYINNHPEDVIMLKDGSVSYAKFSQSAIENLATEVELEVERTRIDNLLALQDGSTTGDAEIQDARLGWDNNTYSSLGTAIRTQFNNLFNSLVAVQDVKPDSFYNKLWVEQTEDESIEVYTKTEVDTMINSLSTEIENLKKKVEEQEATINNLVTPSQTE